MGSSGNRFLGFSDELQKIAAAQVPQKQDKKKWLKNTLLIAAGSGVGAGLGTLIDSVAHKHFGQTYKTLHPRLQQAIIGALSAGSALAANKMIEESQK